MADGQVLIDSKLDTGGITKGAKEIEKEFDQAAKSIQKDVKSIEQGVKDINVDSVADGMSDSFGKESGKIREILNDTSTDARTKAARIASVFREAGEDQSTAMKKAWAVVKNESGSGSKKAVKDIDSIGDKAKKTGNEIESSLGKAFSGLASKLAGTLAAVATGGEILEFGKEAIELGSNLAEVQNVVDVTFGDASGEIDAFAKTAIKQFGLSELSAKQFSSTMGAMLKSMGNFDPSQIVEMSKELTGLAGDMASFYNLDAQEAFDKLRAGISGETEPLKQLGINLSVANLEAFALAQGITKSYDKMTEQEKALLRYNYLLSTTADAQGDFARTQDSWANQTRILTEEFNSLKGTLGQGLINVLNPIITDINNDFMPVLQDLADQFLNLTETFNWDDLFSDVDLGPISQSLETFKEKCSGLADTIGSGLKWAWDNVLVPFGGWAIDAGLPATIDALAAAFDWLGSVFETVAPWIEAVYTALQPLFSFVGEGFVGLMEGISAAFTGIQDSSYVWEKILWGMGESVYPGLVDPMNNGLGEVADGIVEYGGKIGESTRQWLIDTGEAATAAAETAKTGIDSINAAATDGAASAGESIQESYNQAVAGVQESTSQATSQIATDTATMGNQVVNALADTASSVGATAAEPLQESMTAAADATGEAFDNAANTMKTAFGDMGTWFDSNVASPVKTSIEEMGQAALTMWAKMESATTEAWSRMVETVRNSISQMQSAIDGLTGKTVAVNIEKTGSGADLINYTGTDIPAYSPEQDYTPAAYTVTPQIPYLAKGAVIPPRAPFMAMLGDQRNGTNLEAPEDLIRRIVREESGGTLEVKTTVTFAGTLAQFVRNLFPVIKSEAKRRGGSLATEEVLE